MLSYHFGDPFQRGRGLGSFFSGLFKKLIPIASTFFKSPTGQTIKDVAISTASNFATDVFKGKNVKNSAQENLMQAKDQIGEALKRKFGTSANKNSDIVVKKKRKKNRNNKEKFNLLDE